MVWLVQQTGSDKVRIDPFKSSLRLPKWIREHNSKICAYDDYDKCVGGMKKVERMDGDECIPSNNPKGYRFGTWRLVEVMKDL